jgi:PAS domain S-box-containing protein
MANKPTYEELEKKVKALEEKQLGYKHAHEALRESEEKFRTIFESINDEIVYLDVNGTVIDVNNKILDIFGYKREEVIGKDFTEFEFVKSEDIQKTVNHFKNATSGKITSLMEFEAIRKDKTPVFIEVNTKLIEKDGEIKGLVHIIRDITERKRAEEEYLQREKMQAVLETAGATCHELNQPMQTISGYSELLLMGISEKSPLYGKARKIKEQIDRMRKIIAKLMGVARYETKAYCGKTKIIDLDNVREQRKYKRFIPSGRAFVIPKSDAPKQHQMIDISMGGLAFWCNEIQEQLDAFDELSISMADGNFNLNNIPCKTISDLTIADDSPSGSVSMKRCGVQFWDLNPNQTDQLEYLIKNHTIAG